MNSTADPCPACGQPAVGRGAGCVQHSVPENLWRHPTLAKAVADLDLAAVIRFLRANTEMTQEALGLLMGIRHHRVSELENGRRQIWDIRVFKRAVQGLGVSNQFIDSNEERVNVTEWQVPFPLRASVPPRPVNDPVDADIQGHGRRVLSLSFTHGALSQSVENAQSLWQVDLADEGQMRILSVSAREITTPVLRWLVAPPTVLELPLTGTATVRADDVAAIRRACQLFEMLDHEFGGGHARIAAVQYLHSEVRPLLAGRYTTEVGRELFAATAHFSFKVGAMAYDAGLHGLARRYFVQSLNFAHLASDTALAGKALALMSHQANFLGDYRSAVDFARSAKAGTRSAVTPGVYAMYSAMEARGLASLGEERQCTAALAEMEGGFAKRHAEEPAWLGYFDEAEVHDEFAHCFHDLGHAQLAVEHARTASTLTRQEYRRSRTFAGLILAGAHLLDQNAADVEHACALAEQTLSEAGPLRSARVHSYIRRFDDRLAPYAATVAVQRFRAESLNRLGRAGTA